jgi:hypothetical protein
LACVAVRTPPFFLGIQVLSVMTAALCAPPLASCMPPALLASRVQVDELTRISAARLSIQTALALAHTQNILHCTHDLGTQPMQETVHEIHWSAPSGVSQACAHQMGHEYSLRILGRAWHTYSTAHSQTCDYRTCVAVCASTYGEKASRNWRPGLPDPQKPALHRRPDIAVADRPGNEGTRFIKYTQTGNPNIP